MNIEQFLTDKVAAAVSTLYGNAGAPLQIQKTRKEFEGDYTLVVFPLLKASRKSPEATATEIGEYLVANTPEIKAFNVIKGFLNLSLDSAFWAARFREVAANDTFGQAAPTGRTVMIEYSSPNTNKPLHLGHLRNDTDPMQMLFEIHGLILSLHHDARFLRSAGAVDRARIAFERVVQFYATGAPVTSLA